MLYLVKKKKMLKNPLRNLLFPLHMITWTYICILGFYLLQ